MSQTLYARLGGYEKIAKIANDIVDLHAENPVVKTRFAAADLDALKGHARDFICIGTGGPESYEGRTMLEAHRHMNISEQEYLAVVDDVLEALQKNAIGKPEQDEMLAILYSLKGDIIRV